MRYSARVPEPFTHGKRLSSRRRRELRWIFAVIFAGSVGSKPVVAREVPLVEQSVDASVSVPLFVAPVDVDGDGDLDAVVGSLGSGGGTVYWYENSDGAGAFASAQTIGTQDGSIDSLAAADIDGDGDLDILFSSLYYAEIVWLENTGAGSFAVPQVLPTETTNPFLLTTADLDGDGDLDLVVASRPADDGIYWYENNPSNTGAEGTFGTEQIITQLPQEPSAIEVADLDGDGDLDLAVASDDADDITWFANDGAGTFSTQPTIASAVAGARSLRAADLDGDGDLDLLVTSYDDDSVLWFENSDGGSFGSGVAIATAALGANSAVAADLDADGDLDVVSTSHDDDTVAWYENTDGLGGFGSEQAFATLNEAGQPFVGDVDRDGDLDVVAAEISESGSIAWYENETIHRSALFPQRTVIDTAAPASFAVLAVDIDGDGDLDLAHAGETLAWYENADGAGSFGAPNSIDSGVSYGLAVADIDGDGQVDVLTAQSLADRVIWLERPSVGTEWDLYTVGTGLNTATSVLAADLDGDGDLDVAASSRLDDTVAWFENTDGQGSFGTAQALSHSGMAPNRLDVADVNRDGRLDLLAPFQSGEVVWFENTGGSFATAQTIESGFGSVQQVVGADLDGDGDVDVVGVTRDNEIGWWENQDGAGSFGTRWTISTDLGQGNSVSAADLDGDGDLDVASASILDDKIAWYENTDGAGGFGPQHVVTTEADGARFVSVGDMDGDGDLDLLSTSFDGETVAWYENRGGQFSLATADVAQGVVANSELHDLLKIVLTHEGRAGDSEVELTSLELHFTDGSAGDLTLSQVGDRISDLRLYLDDGASPDIFDSSDTMLFSSSSTPLSDQGAGVFTWSFDPTSNLRVAAGSSKTYFLAAQLSGSTSAFDVEHLTGSSSTAEDSPNDIPLILEYAANVQSGVVDTTLSTATCHAPFDLQLTDRTVGTSETVICEAGTVLTTAANVVVTGTGALTLRAGQAIDVEDGLSVESGTFTAEIDPGLEP